MQVRLLVEGGADSTLENNMGLVPALCAATDELGAYLEAAQHRDHKVICRGRCRPRRVWGEKAE